MTIDPGTHRRSLHVDGRDRSYLLHLPRRKPDRSERWPVVLAFHGSGTNAEIMRLFSGLDEKAEEAGFLAVFPNGSGRTPEALAFNVGGNYGLAGRQNINDIHFVETILDDLTSQLPIDMRRVYSTGMSNGGIFSYRLAVELGDRIAAIAPVGGPMGDWDAAPKHAMPVCHFHGMADEHVPFSGGLGIRSLSKILFRSAEDSVRYWARFNGCSLEPEVDELPPLIDDGTSVTRATFPAGPAGAEVILYAIHGMGHTWPGREPMFTTLGSSTHNLLANDVLWEFFARHERT
jgi:polyhydroxybutyrate depolymerase